ncbi:MAG: FAD:protein FMN transferase [Bacteroidetes bacterium]|nr:FAD:protein FMN transferase [Bacteroidota bacterium]MBL6963891.1 FAD:protein FMN transferase [Bacteroidota bacterium]
MGTFYQIKFETEAMDGLKNSIDSLLLVVNNSLSTYIPESTISRLNQSSQSIEVDPFFEQVFIAAKEVFRQTHGAFDPTVMPLVNAWGFGFDTLSYVDSAVIDSLMNFVGFDKVHLRDGKVFKDNPYIMLDFSAIAKGFGVDVIAAFLESKGIANYMVEIGGEVRVKGKNPKKSDWQIAIEKPVDNKSWIQDYELVLSLSDNSTATSGNYRNFYFRNGNKIAHTIDPKAGYPIFNDLLSATVIHKKCMVADAYATAFMVLGKEKSVDIAEKNDELWVYLMDREQEINSDYCSEELKPRLRKITN